MSDVAYDPNGNRAAGADWVKGLYSSYSNMRAGNQLARGDTRAAATTLARSGDITGYRQLTADATAQRTAAKAEELALTQQVLRAARVERDAGRDVGAALQTYRGAFQALGSDVTKFDAVVSQIAANPALIDQLDAMTQEELKWELRAGGNGDTIAVRAPDRNGNTQSRVAYAAPRDPIVTPNAVITPPNRGLAAGQQPLPGQPVAAPMAGPPISAAPLYEPRPPMAGTPVAALPSAMVGITAQAESGNRERDAQGRLITSPAGAQGRMQVMPTTNTNPGYGVVPARDNSDAERTRVGEDYLAAMMREYGGDPAKAWAAYNWGPGNLDRAIAQHGGDWLNYAPAETRAYVANNLRQLNAGQGGEIAQGDDSQDPLVSSAPRVETTADGYRIERFTNPADERAARAEQRAADSAAREAARFNERNMPSASEDRAERRMVIQEQQRLNTDFTKLPVVERFRNTEAEYADVRALARGRGGINSVALTYAIMKMAAGDGSVVRESEFELVGRAAGIPDGTIALMQRAANGDALTPSQRSQIESTAEMLYHTRRREYNREAARFRRFAAESGVNPDRVAPVANNPNGQGAAVTTPPVRGVPERIWRTSTEAQRRYWQQNPIRGPQGGETNPLRLNPADPASAYANVRPGQYYLDPNGNRRQRSGGRQR